MRGGAGETVSHGGSRRLEPKWLRISDGRMGPRLEEVADDIAKAIGDKGGNPITTRKSNKKQC